MLASLDPGSAGSSRGSTKTATREPPRGSRSASSMLLLNSKSDELWFPKAREALRQGGCAVVTDVLAPDEVERTREAMYRTQQEIVAAVGDERLQAAGEVGVLRIPALFDSVFLELLS